MCVEAYDFIKKLVPYKDCLKERADGEFLIVLNSEYDIYYLNQTARFIFQLFDGDWTVKS